jgi:DNA-nicking Smr family endonuclease
MGNLTKEEKDLWDSINKNVKKIVHNKVSQNIKTPIPVQTRIVATKQILEKIEKKQSKPLKSFCIEHLKQRKKARHIKIEGSIDLHGLTLQQSLVQLKRFFYASQLQEKDWVRVITGKSGILRQEIHVLLEENSTIVSTYMEARINDGGSGAFYVKIRKLDSHNTKT